MGRVIAITNQKGGVGKTTTCVNLASALAESGRKVLLVDLDPQGNATMGCGIDSRSCEITSAEVILADNAIEEALIRIDSMKFDLIAANTALTAAEVRLMELIGRERRLRQALEPVTDRYQYILLDCPPSLNMLTVNALTASDGVLIPIQCEYYALEGLASLLDTIGQIKQMVNPDLEIEGILRTMYDGRNNLATEVSEQLLEHFPEQVYRTIIPRNVRVAEAPSHGTSVIHYDQGSRGALAYLGLAGELVRRERMAQRQRNSA